MCCRRRFQYDYIWCIAPLRTPLPWIIGSLAHDLLARFYETGGKFGSEEDALAVIDEHIDKEVETSGADETRIQELLRQRAVVLGLFVGYVSRWGRKDLKDYAKISTEREMEADLAPGGWTYGGKVDVLALNKDTAGMTLFEHKTVASIAPGYLARLPLDTQILGYKWLADKLITGIKVRRLVYNVMRKSALRQRKNETREEFLVRVRDDYTENPDSYFYREILSPKAEDVKRFHAELVALTAEIGRCMDTGFFYQNTLFCDFMGTCPFLPLCVNGEDETQLMHYRWKDRVHEELGKE